MPGHDEWSVSSGGLGAQAILSPESAHSTRGHPNPVVCKRARQCPHLLSDSGVNPVGHNVQHACRIVWKNQLALIYCPLCETFVEGTVRSGDPDSPTRTLVDAVEDDVLLQHCLAGKRRIAEVVDVYPPERELTSECAAKRTKVRAIHEAAGGDRDELTAVLQEF